MGSNQPCTLTQCTNTGDLPSYVGAYSLNSLLNFPNELMIVPIPNGNGQTITIPPGTIVVSAGGGSGVSYLSYQGCLSTVTRAVPAGATVAVLQALAQQIITEIAAQTAQCQANTMRLTPQPPTFSNDSISAGCSDGSQLTVCATPIYPRGLTYQNVGLGFINCAAGMFVSSTKANANALAVAYIESFIAAKIISGNFACGIPCPVDCMGVPSNPADLVWTTQCPCGGSPCPFNESDSSGTISTAVSASGASGTYSMSANANFPTLCSGFCLDSQICNPTASDKQIKFTFTGSFPPTVPGSVDFSLGVSVNGVGQTVWDGTTLNNPVTLVLPAASTVVIEISGQACSDAVGAGANMSGAFTITVT